MDKLSAVLLVSLAVIIMLALNLFFSLFHMYMMKKRYESQPRLLNVLYFLLAISIQVRPPVELQTTVPEDYAKI